ncbi:MAG TPA: hypothetical protein VMN36_17200 [Verrucomicrobiales bacterium]|nr:hypothetical protein [Verrucomicrobiales bacterium]
MRRVIVCVAFLAVAVTAYLLPRPQGSPSPGESVSRDPGTPRLLGDPSHAAAGTGALLEQDDSKRPTLVSALDRPSDADPPMDSGNLRPEASEEGEILWIGYRKEDFSLAHGIEPETVAIPHPPQNAAELDSFLKGTIWGWGRSPRADGEWVMFLDDNTIYGSWGYRYQYHVDPDTMEVVWPDHRTAFSDDFRYLQTEGTNARVGMLLKRVDQAAFQQFMGEADGMDVISETEDSVPNQ